VRHDYAGFAESQLAERRAAGFPPFVFEAALRAEAKKLDTAMRFLSDAARAGRLAGRSHRLRPRVAPHHAPRRLRARRLLMQSARGPRCRIFWVI